MHFRLGEFECDGCGNRQRPSGGDPRLREFAPPQLVTQREDLAAATKTAHAALPQAQIDTLRSTRDYRKVNERPEKYDPSPGIEREKLILLAVYSGRVALTVILALARGADFSDNGWLAKDMVGWGLLALALFTPVIPVKMVVAYLSGIVGGMSLLGVFWSLFTMGLVGGIVAPSFTGFLGFTGGIIVSFIAAVIELWLASTLFRDAHRVQVLRGV